MSGKIDSCFSLKYLGSVKKNAENILDCPAYLFNKRKIVN